MSILDEQDPRAPNAGAWLEAGPGGRDVDLAVIGVPAFVTAFETSGTHKTPAAVRRQLRSMSTWCGSRRVDLADLAPWDRGDVDDPDVEVEGEWRVRTAAETAAAKSRLVIAIGGDNSITFPVLAGAFGPDITRAGLVALDAHHDIHEGRGSRSHLRQLIEAGLDPERIVHVGAADWSNSRSYADEAHARGITIFSATQVEHRGIDECMREALSIAGSEHGPIYVSFDLSVCDRSVAPAARASQPGGLSATQLFRAAWIAGQHPTVGALDITEVDATIDPDERTVRLAALCLVEAAAGLCQRQ